MSILELDCKFKLLYPSFLSISFSVTVGSSDSLVRVLQFWITINNHYFQEDEPHNSGSKVGMLKGFDRLLDDWIYDLLIFVGECKYLCGWIIKMFNCNWANIWFKVYGDGGQKGNTQIV